MVPFRYLVRWFVILLGLCSALLAAQASATVADLQAAAQGEASLIHQYTFDGGDDTQRQADKRGSADLFEVEYGIPPDFIGYDVAGFDSSSRAVQTQRIEGGSDGEGGAGFRSEDITLDDTVTVEAVFRTREADITGVQFNLGYIVSNRNGTTGRGYFLIQGSADFSHGDDLLSLIGESFATSNALTLAEGIQGENWYYAASTFRIDSATDTTTISGYIADLTNRDATLTTVGPETVDGQYSTVPGTLGIGIRVDANSESFPGLIDEVNVYSDVLSQNTLQDHLERLLFGASTALQAGDADQDLDFDQIDLVQVQVAAKYLTGQAATWGEGDWNGAPGGEQGNPPAGDALFDQLDIIAALGPGQYLTGPYAAIAPGGQPNDAQTSIVYNVQTGELGVDAPAGMELTSINIDSAAGAFTGDPARNLGGSFDNDADGNIFKATFGSSFGSLSFGNVAQPGLAEQFLLDDLSVVGSLQGGGALGDVDLIYVPEPSGVVLLILGALVFLRHGSQRQQP